MNKVILVTALNLVASVGLQAQQAGDAAQPSPQPEVSDQVNPQPEEPAPAKAVPAPADGGEVLPPLGPDGVPLTPTVEQPEPLVNASGPADLRKDVVTRSLEDINVRVPLSGIALLKDSRARVTEKAQEAPKGVSGISLSAQLSTPKPDELKQKLQKFLGKEATFGDLEKIVAVVLDHYIENDRPMTHVYIPYQQYAPSISFYVVEGVVGEAVVLTEEEVTSKPPGSLTALEKSFLTSLENKSKWEQWYSNPYKSSELKAALEPRLDGLKGKVVDKKEINHETSAINRSPWARLNRPVAHPFRDVDVVFSPPAGDDARLGQTDLVLQVRDSRPLKFFLGFENDLTELLGDNRFFVGSVWYDAFNLGLDHQLGAQVFSALDPSELLGISTSYVIPWRNTDHTTEFNMAYAVTAAQVETAGIPTDLDGSNLLFAARHFFELPELFGASDFSEPLGKDKNPYSWAGAEREAFGLHHEIGAGFDYKSSDNTVAFGGTTAADNPADIIQFVTEYNARQTDPSGETNLGWQLIFSPGDLTGNNDDVSFAPLRFDSSATYFYTKLKLDREQDLPYDFMAKAALTGQVSNENLLASEELGVGGYNSVRGYPERVHLGDIGYTLNLELYSPEFAPLRDWFKKGQYTDNLRFLTFFDVGYAEAVSESASDPLDDESTLMSVGAGFRYEFDDNVRIRLDYGFQLEEPNPAADVSGSGAIHMGAVWTF